MQAHIDINDVVLRVGAYNRRTRNHTLMQIIGLDTEADPQGKVIMVSTSDGETYRGDEIPRLFFSRRRANKKYGVWNLKYEEGAFLQHLPRESLEELRESGRTAYDGYIYRNIARKMLRITRGKNAVEIYDIAGFYEMSLELASTNYLGEHKIEIATKSFDAEYVREHWAEIARYCVRDAELAKKLADLILYKFAQLGVYPKHLYSFANVAYTYYNATCKIPLMRNIYDNHKPVLQYALNAYAGGKFEVTQKGPGRYWEYDIISAYPAEIADLVDIERAYIVRDKKFRRGAVYGYIFCDLNIPPGVSSPVPVSRGGVRVYPVGRLQCYITKSEYQYLISHGCDITIHDAYWLEVGKRIYPFRREVQRLVRLKEAAKTEGREHDVLVAKKLLNCLYGKFVQLILRDGKYEAGRNWNIIYGSIITANCRVRVTEYQQSYPDVVAVHTDSVISTSPLPIAPTSTLGDMRPECAGDGLILGTGIYQIGGKTKFRGFSTSVDLRAAIEHGGGELKITRTRPYSWREVVFHGWDAALINQFCELSKNVSLNFDCKRIWFDDWTKWSEVLSRSVYSSPIPVVQFPGDR